MLDNIDLNKLGQGLKTVYLKKGRYSPDKYGTRITVHAKALDGYIAMLYRGVLGDVCINLAVVTNDYLLLAELGSLLYRLKPEEINKYVKDPAR